MLRRTGIVAALFLAAGCVAADAQFTWKNVQIGGRSDFTIDMPAKVDPETKLDSGQLFGFFASSDDDDIFCILSLNIYTADVTREKVIAGIGSDRRNVFCDSTDNSLKDFSVIESKAAANSGYPAGVCAASFTDPSEKKSAGVVSSLVVAAPAGMYVLRCEFNASDPDDLAVDWVDDFEDFTQHLQDSLKLPG